MFYHVKIACYHAPPFNLPNFVFFLPCGTMSPRNITLQDVWQHRRRRMRLWCAHRVVTESTDRWFATRAKWVFKWSDRRYLFHHVALSNGYDSSRSWRMMEQCVDALWRFDWRSSDGNWSQSWTSMRGIVTTGCGQRGRIRSHRSLSDNVDWEGSPIDAWLWPDRRAIMVRSSRDRGSFEAKSRPQSLPIDGPRSPCDRGHEISLPTGSNDPKIVRKFSFKNRCIPSCFLISWLNREGIKRFERKILSSSWSPAFRLDFDQNRSGIDHEFHRISLDFPLERRTSARKKSSQIHFNPSELKPRSCGNRFSSEIRSIIRW